MAGSVNKVILVGRLGKDPEMKYTQSGDPVANFSVATDESWKDSNGERQERTEWHRIVAFKKLAEIIGKYLTKGAQVYVEGKLQTRSWEKDGEKKYSTEIVATSLTMLGKKSDDNGSDKPKAEGKKSKPAPKRGAEIDDDDNPF